MIQKIISSILILLMITYFIGSIYNGLKDKKVTLRGTITYNRNKNPIKYYLSIFGYGIFIILFVFIFLEFVINK